jgi:hemerythrin-like domain-containing protein
MNRRTVLAATAALVAPAVTAPAFAAEEKKITAVEDLMREHGILRRAFLAYTESIAPLRRDAAKVDARALHDTAQLFRAFGEDYHERKLEEAFIFPAVRKAGGKAAGYVGVLVAQHNRGREITDFVLAKTSGARVRDGEALARVFEGFAVMYANHTAREDTIVFPAWKQALSEHALDEMGEKFEDIEKKTFGRDGFDDAVSRMDRIEAALGLSDLARFTAPPPH